MTNPWREVLLLPAALWSVQGTLDASLPRCTASLCFSLGCHSMVCHPAGPVLSGALRQWRGTGKQHTNEVHSWVLWPAPAPPSSPPHTHTHNTCAYRHTETYTPSYIHTLNIQAYTHKHTSTPMLTHTHTHKHSCVQSVVTKMNIQEVKELLLCGEQTWWGGKQHKVWV